jgi:hypothetical protein
MGDHHPVGRFISLCNDMYIIRQCALILSTIYMNLSSFSLHELTQIFFCA